MSELKPCPFCGARGSVEEEGPVSGYAVRCGNCDSQTPIYLRADLAIKAWNRRAERTCEQIDVTEMYKPYTTHMTECSECGGVLAVDEMPAPNYCPICGAKVER